ncbi:MAG: SUMF1/EgtB/PvdO family nonheme iron enzyme [Chloroflexi bacterium]|nr:SUMF1/EgtB/PvdO family nonheme iron enzyme [Chloroflexota bacterium]
MRGRWFLSALLAVAMLLALGSTMAQPDPIPDMQTVEAAVQARFTGTAEAQGYSTLALTVDAVFGQALTATALQATITPSPTYTVTHFPLTLTAQATIPQSPAAEPLDLFGSPLVAIPGGTFEMGTTPQEVAEAVRVCVEDQGGNCLMEYGEDSIPVHTVRLSPYYLEISEVTVDQYVRFLNTLGPGGHRAGCDGQPCATTQTEDSTSNIRFDGQTYSVRPLVASYPVTNVTWYGAKGYCQTIGRRLPTEAEWEFAARGFEGSIYPWGNTWDAAYAKTSIPVSDEVGPVSIMRYMIGASPFGLADMAGNAAEWVNDWYDPTFYRQPEASRQNPTGPVAGEEKVIRGGSWDAKPFFARSVHRQSRDPLFSGPWLGFRCAADSDPVQMATLNATLTVSPQPTQPPRRATLPPTPLRQATPTATP